ncbi:MAG: phosphoadenylyl-sulfate reductase [Planctomycetota bacterium]
MGATGNERATGAARPTVSTPLEVLDDRALQPEPVPDAASTQQDPHAERRAWAATMSEKLADASAEDVIKWGYAEFGTRLSVMTGLGYSGIVMLHAMLRSIPSVPVYFIDTRQHFPETLALIDRLRAQWGLRIQVLQTAASEDDIEAAIGPDAWTHFPDLCCHMRKVEPLAEVRGSADAWISALRRDQAETRSAIQPVEVDGRGDVKLYPLAAWTRADCWDYIKRNDLPYNPLHNEGFPSIGCKHCTRRVKPGEHERAGRWSGRGKTECGLHDHRPEA